jgi:hypothetical protein
MTWSVGGLLQKRNFGAEEGILLCRLAAGATKSDLAKLVAGKDIRDKEAQTTHGSDQAGG